MAELDYAYLADYAAVEAGRITAVGASFTHLNVEEFPLAWRVSVAGRIRAPQDVDQVGMAITIAAPDEEWVIRGEAIAQPDDSARPYDGKVGILFALSIPLPISRPGLYVVNIELDGAPVRRLAFEAGLRVPN